MKDTRANVTLPAEMRPLLDKAQELLRADSWTGTVQELLERVTAKERAELDEVAALTRVSKALHFAFGEAGLDIALKTIEKAVRAAATDTDPLAFAAFSLSLYGQVKGQADTELKGLREDQDEVNARLEKLEEALAQPPQPKINIKNADADADADADTDS